MFVRGGKTMPMQTFFNLPEDKKNTILKAARQEFSRVLLEDASIANIIKIAGIPRGSFYQYFYDKEDLFLFMIHNMGHKVMQRMVENLNQNEGDLIDASIQLFEYTLMFIRRDENDNFIKNIFMSMNDIRKEALSKGFEKRHFHRGTESTAPRLRHADRRRSRAECRYRRRRPRPGAAKRGTPMTADPPVRADGT
jgi:AcrR family transcriptional regulator